MRDVLNATAASFEEIPLDSENRKFTILSFLLTSVLAAYVFYLFATAISDLLKIGGMHWGFEWPVIGGSISGLFGLILFIGLTSNSTARNFIDDVFAELRKVTWPSSQDTTKSTVVVTIMVCVAAGIIFLIDSIWQAIFRFVL